LLVHRRLLLLNVTKISSCVIDWSICPKIPDHLSPNPHCRAKRPIQDWIDQDLGRMNIGALCAKAPPPLLDPRPPRLISISETPRHREASIHKTSPPPFQNLLRLYYDVDPSRSVLLFFTTSFLLRKRLVCCCSLPDHLWYSAATSTSSRI
jgi:hypothetical protein